MKVDVKENLDLFVENNQILKEEFKWEEDLVTRLAAFFYAQENRKADGNAIRKCYDLIKSNTGIFSIFRDNNITLATLMSLTDDPEEMFRNVKKAYNTLKDAKFSTSDYLVVVAYQIASNVSPENYSDVTKRAKAFYDGMKVRHRFLTDEEDYILAVMLGLSDIDVDTGSANIEKLFDCLRSEFKFDKDSIQTLSHILILANKSSEGAQRVIDIQAELEKQKIHFDKTYSLSLLGLLSLLPDDVGKLVQEVSEVQSYLQEQKGFKGISISRDELFLFSVAIVLTYYCESINSELVASLLSAGIIDIIITEMMMMVTTMTIVNTIN